MNVRSFLSGSVLALVIFVSACGADRNDSVSDPDDAAARTTDEVTASDAGPYRLAEPDMSVALPGELTEISAITTTDDGSLAAVQDEEGIIYILDPQTGAVVGREEFGDTGDYEGIAWTGDRFFVLRSNGRLFEITGLPGGSPEVEVTRTPLRGRNDAEGLAYDAENGRLLIACKEDAGAGLDKEMKAIYAFDLQSRTLSEEPVFVLNTDELQATTPIDSEFKPSGIAIHPRSREIYVLSATAGAIVVLSPEGQVRTAWRLSRSLYEQAEGLAFHPDGTLFVSSEGGNGPAMLYRYAWLGSE